MAAASQAAPLPHHVGLRVLDEPGQRWLSALTTKKLQRSARLSVKALADETLERLAGYCAAVNNNEW